MNATIEQPKIKGTRTTKTRRIPQKETRLRVHQYDFHSKAAQLLPETDRKITQNSDFSFQLIKPDDGQPAKKLILMLHGFNEKSWDKYLDWGEALCRESGSAVLYFPIAFHMQRAPQNWSDRREMYQLSQQRQSTAPNNQCSSLSNAAISRRMEEEPGRLLSSGLESYYDVIQLIEECRGGRYDQLHPDFSLDIFGYSIGGLLAELLKFSNPGGHFTKSKLCLFCSGPVFSRLSPVSRYILDSEAHQALQNYMLGQKETPAILNTLNPETKSTFLSMIDYDVLEEYREQKLRQYRKDIYAIVLKQDQVIPSVEVVRTLQGQRRDTGIRVDQLDFSYPYSHESPFSSVPNHREASHKAFRQVFRSFGNFLR